MGHSCDGMIISVITVVLNGEDTIERTIKSVLSQNYPDIEYIVIDGGSTDGTVEIIKKYADKISYWISEDDDGLYFAMNKGLRRAKGNYVYFLNSGDCFLNGAVRRVFSLPEIDKTDVICCNVVNKNGIEWPKPFESFYWRMAAGHQMVFVKRNIHGEFDTNYKFAADYKLIYGLYKEGRVFSYVPVEITFCQPGGLSDNLANVNSERASVSCSMMDETDENYDRYRQCIMDVYIDFECEVIMKDPNDPRDATESFINELSDESLIIFGTGDISKRHWIKLEPFRKRIKYFVDNDKNKWGTYFNSIRIESPDCLKKETNKYIYILNERYCEEIKMQIASMSLDPSNRIDDFISAKGRFRNKHRSEILERAVNLIPGFERLYFGRKE